MRPGINRRCRECRAILDFGKKICRDYGFCDRQCAERYHKEKK